MSGYLKIGCKQRSVTRARAASQLAADRRRERWLARNQPTTAKNITARLARERLEGRPS